ncbi:MAG: substrate-binding domain-containing protein [Planctomycetia bacterium]|nr:substrate-binding domain-containing protein [Planctomycetia bacterium]
MNCPKLTLNEPLPSYRADVALRDVLIDYIIQSGRSVGDEFYSDRELGEIVGKSRGVVRRALDGLQEEGWIERRGGIGTFVGPRAEQPRGQMNRKSADTDKSDAPSVMRKKLNHCLVVNAKADSSYSWGLRSWCTEIMDVFSALSQNSSVMIEYLNSSYADNPKLLRRLESAPPDAIFCMGPPLDHLNLMHFARQANIPLILAGTRAPELDVYNVCEDSVTAGEEAVKKLYDLGHRRIGFVQSLSSMTGWWFVDRYQGYINGMKKCGLFDEFRTDLVCWQFQTQTFTPAEEGIRAEFLDYYEAKKPTAIILGCSYLAACLRNLCRDDGIRVPEDLSIIVYDQSSEVVDWFGGLKPTTIVFPLEDIGKTLFSHAEKIINNIEVPRETRVACVIDDGTTVAEYKHM